MSFPESPGLFSFFWLAPFWCKPFSPVVVAVDHPRQVEQERLMHSRPWRRNPHDIWHHSAKLTFAPSSVTKYGLMLELNATTSQSKDPFDRQKTVVLSIRYRWDDTKW
ncbi:MAG: hypothetical protein O2832_04855 [Proteobacteria bacterium]|nr:hypothetical protein [Pseudomonadota bacterium]